MTAIPTWANLVITEVSRFYKLETSEILAGGKMGGVKNRARLVTLFFLYRINPLVSQAEIWSAMNMKQRPYQELAGRIERISVSYRREIEVLAASLGNEKIRHPVFKVKTLKPASVVSPKKLRKSLLKSINKPRPSKLKF